MEQAKPKILCNKGGDHQDELIQWICLNKGCSDNLLACNICCYESHMNHNVVPIKIILRQLKEQVENNLEKYKNQDVNQQDFQEVCSEFDKSSTEQLNAVEEIISIFNKLKQKIHKFNLQSKQQFQTLCPSIDAIQGMLGNFNDSIGNYDTLKETLQNLLPLSDFYNTDNNQSLKPEKVIAAGKDQLEAHTKSILNFMKTFQKQVQTVEKYLNQPLDFSNSYKLKFQNLNTQDITYTNNYTIAKRTTSAFYKICLVTKPLNKNKITKFSFKIIDPVSWLGVGMCYKKVVEKLNYNFNFTQMNHGGYMISSNGGTWSHHEPTYNNIVATYHFHSNDIIECTFDGPNKKIYFNASEDRTYELNVRFEEDDELYPSVAFYYQNSSVELLNKAQ